MNTTTAIATLTALFIANGMSATTAQNLASLNVELESKLANGAVTFSFKKADGTIRKAIGTNKQTIVPNFYTFKGANIKENNQVQRYFDLEANGFRSYRKENLIAIG